MSRELVARQVAGFASAIAPAPEGANSKVVSRETISSSQTMAKLDIYVALLLKWQKVQNLISPTTIDDIWGRHIADSLHLLPHLKGKTAVDFGTGAGLPGLILAIVRPDIHFHLVESNQRKCAFLQEAARQTQANVTIHPIRAEDFTLQTDIVMARAMTALSELLVLARRSVDNGGYALFPKGKSHQDELTLAAKTFIIGYEILNVPTGKVVSRAIADAKPTTLEGQTINDTQSVILKITKIERR